MKCESFISLLWPGILGEVGNRGGIAKLMDNLGGPRDGCGRGKCPLSGKVQGVKA